MLFVPNGSSAEGEGRRGQVVWWLLGLATAIAAAGSGSWAATTSHRLDAVEASQSSQTSLGSRLDERTLDIVKRLDRIEAKQDELLNRAPSK